MARSVRKAGLETRTARLKLAVERKPVFIRIGPGLSLGYRRNQTDGTWVLRIADGKGGATTRAIGAADDFDDANGATVLDYWQAQEKAKSVARGSNGSDISKPLTVRRAAEVYLTVLEIKNPDGSLASRHEFENSLVPGGYTATPNQGIATDGQGQGALV